MKRQSGFTLVEIMVVVVIVALMLAFGYLGFSQLQGRRADQDLASLQRWVQLLSERAQLEGAVYGAALEEDRLSAFTYRQGYWLRVLDQGGWTGSGGYTLNFELEAEQAGAELRGAGDNQPPDLIFLPDGSQVPDGRLHFATEEQDYWLTLDEQGQFALEQL